jgi:hypothetical protein
VVVAGNAVNSSKSTATGPVDGNLSREVELLHKEFYSCWCNEAIEARFDPLAPPLCLYLYLMWWPRALVSKVFRVITLIITSHLSLSHT